MIVQDLNRKAAAFCDTALNLWVQTQFLVLNKVGIGSFQNFDSGCLEWGVFAKIFTKKSIFPKRLGVPNAGHLSRKKFGLY